jgi:sulfur carrier protein
MGCGFLFSGGAMTVMVNGEPMELPEGLTIEGLLDQLKVRREYTAVALNREVWPKSRYAETVLKDGDRVEIVRPMGGG